MILDREIPRNSTISFCGMSKNSGKTVAMLAAMEETPGKSMTPGLISIGRDGEEKDIVFDTKKPLIYANQGTIIATCEGLWNFKTAVLSIEEHLNFHTPMGDVLICKVIQPGYVEIAGAQSISETIKLRDKMFEYGADIVLIDGALSRTSLAVSDLCDKMVISTGASLSKDMSEVINQTAFLVKLFNLPESPTYKEEIEKIMKEDSFGIIDSGILKMLDFSTTLGQEKIFSEILSENTEMVIFSKALTEKTLNALSNSISKPLKVIAKDGTKFFIDEKSYNKYLRRGIEFYCANRVEILCITINPVSVRGDFFSSDEFLINMGKALPGMKIVNAMTGENYVYG